MAGEGDENWGARPASEGMLMIRHPSEGETAGRSGMGPRAPLAAGAGKQVALRPKCSARGAAAARSAPCCVGGAGRGAAPRAGEVAQSARGVDSGRGSVGAAAAVAVKRTREPAVPASPARNSGKALGTGKRVRLDFEGAERLPTEKDRLVPSGGAGRTAAHAVVERGSRHSWIESRDSILRMLKATYHYCVTLEEFSVVENDAHLPVEESGCYLRLACRQTFVDDPGRLSAWAEHSTLFQQLCRNSGRRVQDDLAQLVQMLGFDGKKRTDDREAARWVWHTWWKANAADIKSIWRRFQWRHGTIDLQLMLDAVFMDGHAISLRTFDTSSSSHHRFLKYISAVYPLNIHRLAYSAGLPTANVPRADLTAIHADLSLLMRHSPQHSRFFKPMPTSKAFCDKSHSNFRVAVNGLREVFARMHAQLVVGITADEITSGSRVAEVSSGESVLAAQELTMAVVNAMRRSAAAGELVDIGPR